MRHSCALRKARSAGWASLGQSSPPEGPLLPAGPAPSSSDSAPCPCSEFRGVDHRHVGGWGPHPRGARHVLLLLLQEEEEPEAGQERGESHEGARREADTAGGEVREATGSPTGRGSLRGSDWRVTLIRHESPLFLCVSGNVCLWVFLGCGVKSEKIQMWEPSQGLWPFLSEACHFHVCFLQSVISGLQLELAGGQKVPAFDVTVVSAQGCSGRSL